jgi:glycosyltransferase involved in cell wall biosynthesis
LWHEGHFDISPPEALVPGLALIGYPWAETGLGEALRLLAAAAGHAHIPFCAFDIGQRIQARQNDRRLLDHISGNLNRRVNLFVVSSLYAAHSVRLLGPRALAGRRNILYPLWELPEWPAAWASQLAIFDQIWAPSRFIAKALAPRFRGAVKILPPPMVLPAKAARWRADFGLPADRFLFYFFFDYASFAARKNPEAVIAAFRRCAEMTGPGRVGLVLKSMGEGYSQRDRHHVAKLVAGAPDVFLIDSVLERADMLALQSLCDCFVSLHRSEGFGLGIAEAMALGKPVIATNFGGAADLLAPDRSCPIGSRLIAVAPDEYPGGAGQFWADPDIEEAAAAMRRMVEEPDYGWNLAARARVFVEEYLSPSRIGRKMSEYLVAPAAGPPAVGDERRPV